jgi:hypothetical protein
MRKAVFLLLAAASSGAWADWSKWEMVDRTESFIVYADTATIRKSGDVARMWDLSDAKTEKAFAVVKSSRSFKSEREYDCAKQQLRLLYISWHSANMGEGAIIGSDAHEGNWQPALLGTIGERLWKIACGKDRGRRF